MRKILFLLFFTISAFTNYAQEVKNIILEVSEYKEVVVAKDVQLVDVRTPKEYQEGSIDDSINIDYLDQVKFNTAFRKLDKNKPLYIYCRSGNRSQKSAKLLLELGFTEIYDLKGGYNAWSNQ
mgnify:CR=1 FL=1